MRYILHVAICFLIASGIAAEAPTDPDGSPVTIESPADWAHGYFYKGFGGDSVLVRQVADMDHDGTDEVFVGWPAARGRNGIPFAVFKRESNGYRFLGELFLREDFVNFKVLPLSSGGEIRFVVYWAHGGCEGTISTMTHDGTKFAGVGFEKVCAGDGGTEEGRRRLREVFGDQASR